MKTIVLEAPGHFRLTDTEAPGHPGPGEALVRVRRVGICGTDLHAFKGDQPFMAYPRILGHELGVEVVEVGENSGNVALQAGDYCTVEPYLNCGQCSACRRGKTNCCSSLKTLGVHTDGGMREWITMPVHKLHKAPGVALDHLALVEMLCIGAHAVRRAQLSAGDTVLVVGGGPIGLSTIQFAQLAGARVIGMEVSDRRIEFASTHLGVQDWVDPRQEPAARLRQLNGGDLPITVFDATGNPRSMAQAFRYVEQGGKLVFVGLVQDEIPLPDAEFHRRETTLFASRNATAEDFAHVIAALASGQVQLDAWITHRASPEQLVSDFANWTDPAYGVVKAMLEL
ncbi:MAG TPA: zinc-binding alcohol dehydrogenase family protein [Caldilineaceae bacterium]|nr:zinc-binding alcohol dehydrogenase family protein [Caldilineaceae bacterium]